MSKWVKIPAGSVGSYPESDRDSDLRLAVCAMVIAVMPEARRIAANIATLPELLR